MALASDAAGDGSLGEAAVVGATGDCVATGVVVAGAGASDEDGDVAAGVLGATAGVDDEFGLSLATGGDVAAPG